jgi:hypothetical protein
MFGRNVMKRDAVFAILKDKGVAKVEVQYSGGGDEGGVNEIYLYDNAGKQVASMEEYYGASSVWDEATKTYKPADPPNDEQKLSMALCSPVYDKYGGFAGEFYVSGTVTWDVTTGKINDHGVEEVRHDEDFDEDL